ncbi:type II secretion system minor pseudopilin GspI [Citrobacter sp. EC_71]|uniref:type II secretion system minor pseudopilin GspI n=1 Tax=Citrobacter sp. EC_71 TaxID=2584093 RepID=UPI0010C9A0C0|nr:type II secretion system minor pseudopilin GspI [Citrobacter sp. EC_71]MBW9354202.1 type II secretion system minor pseudopilin GspI [Citrobacter sp. EC_71]TKT99322.1 type II secretion system protein GspI [Citrobacter sp. wls830]
MNAKQSGMLLLEVLLAMTIFATAILALITSMQWQLTAIQTMQQETLALWSADNTLINARGSQLSTDKGTDRQNALSLSWQMTATTSDVSQIQQQQVVVTQPDGRTSSLSGWSPVEQEKESSK